MTTKDYIACGLILLGLMMSAQLTSAEGGQAVANDFSADNVVVSTITTGSQASIGKTLSLNTDAGKAGNEIAPLAGSVVPEPTTIGLLCLGGMALLAKRNRRRQAV